MSFSEHLAVVDRALLGVFGEPVPVTYDPAAGPSVQVTGIFDADYVLAKGGAEAGVEAAGLAVFLRLDDLPIDPEDDEPTLTIRGVSYSVVERRKDGMGGITLVLRSSS